MHCGRLDEITRKINNSSMRIRIQNFTNFLDNHQTEKKNKQMKLHTVLMQGSELFGLNVWYTVNENLAIKLIPPRCKIVKLCYYEKKKNKNNRRTLEMNPDSSFPPARFEHKQNRRNIINRNLECTLTVFPSTL